MEVANLESFRIAKEKLDKEINAAVNEFKESTTDCKLIDIEIIMNGMEEGIVYKSDGTIKSVRVIIEVV